VFGRGRPFLLLVVAAVSVALGLSAARVRLEMSNESMNAADPVLQRVQHEFRQAFGSDEVVFVSLTRPDLLEPRGLAALDRLTGRIASIEGVRRVLSLSNAVEVVAGPFGAEERPLAAPIAAALDRNPHLAGWLVSADRRTAGIVVEIAERPGEDGHRARIIDELRRVKREQGVGGSEIHLTGIVVLKHDSAGLVQRDQRVLLPASIVVLALALAVATRHVSGVLLPLLVTAVTLVWTVGIFTALGFRVNIITSLLPPVLLVLSITTSLHLYQEWAALGPLHSDRRVLARRVLREMAWPISLTALTTAMGLGSLAVSDVPAVQQFGLFAALGILLSLLLNLTLLPMLMSMSPVPAPRHARRESHLRPWLERTAELSIRRPGRVLLLATAVSLLAGAGATRIRNNTDLLRFLDPGAELYRDTMFIDRHLAGAGSLELICERADGEPFDRPVDFARLQAFIDEVSGLDEVTSVLGIPALVAQVHGAELDLPGPALPDDEDELIEVLDLLEASDRREEIDRLISPDLRRTRISVRIHAIGTHEALGLLERIEERAGRTLGAGYRVTPTGSFHRVVADSTGLVRSQLGSFTLALALVFLAIGASLRSVRLLLAALIPNLLPILWLAGLMGWLRIDLSTATAMIASVVLGVAVDGSIHYLERFRRLHRGDLVGAVRETTMRTGRVVTMASLVLAVGFWVGALGSFRPTVHFSLLTGGTILFALICDLLVLPACLLLARPRPGGGR